VWIWGLIALLLFLVVMTIFGGLGGVTVALVLPALVLTVGVMGWFFTRGTRA
jgi:hypothetical protein